MLYLPELQGDQRVRKSPNRECEHHQRVGPRCEFKWCDFSFGVPHERVHFPLPPELVNDYPPLPEPAPRPPPRWHLRDAAFAHASKGLRASIAENFLKSLSLE